MEGPDGPCRPPGGFHHGAPPNPQLEERRVSYDDDFPGHPPVPEDEGPESDRPSVMVASAESLPLRTREVEHPSIPENAVGLGTYLHGRLIGRQALTADAVPAYETLLDTPRRLAYIAYEKDDGSVEGRLAALIRPSEVRELSSPADEEDEPWKASVPTWEGDAGSRPGGGWDDDRHVAVLPLGFVVRMVQRRTHPEDLAAEAADVLRTVVAEGATEIVDQFLDTL